MIGDIEGLPRASGTDYEERNNFMLQTFKLKE
jgi:hypothetical protein